MDRPHRRGTALAPGRRAAQRFNTGYGKSVVLDSGVPEPDIDLLVKPFTVESLGRKLQQMLDAR
jgi:hypothetical protein